MDEVGKNPWQQGEINVFTALSTLYENMLEAYRGSGDSEERANKALEIFDNAKPWFEILQEDMTKILDLYNLLLEALKALREQRAKGEAKAVTLRGKGCLVVKLVPCGKKCNGCPHGPYAYEVHKVGGKQIWKYLGRAR